MHPELTDGYEISLWQVGGSVHPLKAPTYVGVQ